jgi:hypothetical protein
VIQDEVNLLAHLDVIYPFSLTYPSEKAETMEAAGAQSEVKVALSRMIGAEIQYARNPAGFSVRQAEFGYQNKKIDVDGKKRVIRAPLEPEANWIRLIFALRAEGTLTDEEIVKKLNGIGFKTRTYNRREQQMKKVVGKFGGNPLTVKVLRNIIKKPIYAGVIEEIWVRRPFKATLWEGLVPVEIYNKANRGKWFIEVHTDNSATIIKNKVNFRVQKDKNNPLYPYKNHVLCPYCRKLLKGSASTGKTHGRYPFYHCSNKHKWFGVRKEKFEQQIDAFVSSLKLKKGFSNDVRLVIRDVYQKERDKYAKTAEEAQNYVKTVKAELDTLLMEGIMKTSSAVVKQDLVAKYEEKKLELALVLDERNNSEQKELDMSFLENELLKLMENPRELLLQGAEMIGLGNMFARFFTRTPTYEELVNGNPPLTPIFELTRHQEITKDRLVHPEGLEPPTSASATLRSIL